MQLNCGLCSIRSWTMADAESLARHANNRNIWRNLRDRFPHPYAIGDAHTWIAAVLSAPRETSFAITVEDAPVGSIGLTLGTDVERISAEVGYWLGEEYWGRGIVTLAVSRFTQFAFDEFELHRIFAVPFTSNHASRRVLVKAGYSLEGTLRRSSIKEGMIHDQALYACVRGAEEY